MQTKIPTQFREDKTTQTAALLLQLRGGTMSYMKLIKLLYIIDRRALLNWRRPVTFDHYVSMDNGPVLSKTYNLINEGVEVDSSSYWHRFISHPADYSVSLKQPCEPDDLSDAEIGLIESVFKEFGHLNRWELVKLTHDLFPEWEDPDGSAIPIEYSDILKAGGKTSIEISSIKHDLDSLAFMRRILHAG